MASIKKGYVRISYCAINDVTGKYEMLQELLKVPNSTVEVSAANRGNAIDIVNKYIKGKPKFKNYRVNGGKIKYGKTDAYYYYYDVPLININDQNDSKCNLVAAPEQMNPSMGGRKRRKTMRTMRKKRGSRKHKQTRRH